VVQFAYGRVTGTATTFTVTFGGATVTQQALIGSNNTPNQGGCWLGTVLNSAIGSTGLKNLVITYTGGGVIDIEAGVICLSGQDGSTPLGTAATAFGAAAGATINRTDSVTGDMVVAGASSGQSLSTPTQTFRWGINQNANSGGGNGAGQTAAGAAGTVTLAYTSTDWWGMTVVTVKQASATSNYTQSAYRFYNDDGIGLGEPP
jgi:hypothetical protein